MDNLDKIIKQKVENFEVPFNEAHWAEMEGKLNAIRSKKIKGLLLRSTAVITVLSIFIYILFPFAPATNIKSNAKNSVEKINPTSLRKSVLVPHQNALNKEVLNISTKKTEVKVVATKEEPQKQIIIQQEQKTIASKTILEKKLVLTKEKPEVKENAPEVPKEKTIATEPKENSTTIPLSDKNSVTAADQRKRSKHRAYEDEYLSKKSVKRSKSRNFFNFKRKYKLTIPKKVKKSK